MYHKAVNLVNEVTAILLPRFAPLNPPQAPAVRVHINIAKLMQTIANTGWMWYNANTNKEPQEGLAHGV